MLHTTFYGHRMDDRASLLLCARIPRATEKAIKSINPSNRQEAGRLELFQCLQDIHSSEKVPSSSTQSCCSMITRRGTFSR
jgi:hypothetical protein